MPSRMSRCWRPLSSPRWPLPRASCVGPLSSLAQSLAGDRLTAHVGEKLIIAANRWTGLARFEDPAFQDDLHRARNRAATGKHRPRRLRLPGGAPSVRGRRPGPGDARPAPAGAARDRGGNSSQHGHGLRVQQPGRQPPLCSDSGGSAARVQPERSPHARGARRGSLDGPVISIRTMELEARQGFVDAPFRTGGGRTRALVVSSSPRRWGSGDAELGRLVMSSPGPGCWVRA